MRSNCMIHAFHRWITRGGWLIMRRSAITPYIHFIHADHLPEDLPVSQYVDKKGKKYWLPWLPLFSGEVDESIGTVKPPVMRGKFDAVIAIYAISNIIGVSVLFYGIFLGVGKLIEMAS